MALSCNIDRKGRLARGITGFCSLVAGLIAIITTWPPAWWEWALGITIIAMGAFVAFEACVGWCAVRAMGFRTPL